MLPTTTHQLKKRDTMENFVCMDYKTSVIVLISIILNVITLVIVVYMTKRNCTKGVRIWLIMTENYCVPLLEAIVVGLCMVLNLFCIIVTLVCTECICTISVMQYCRLIQRLRLTQIELPDTSICWQYRYYLHTLYSPAQFYTPPYTVNSFQRNVSHQD